MSRDYYPNDGNRCNDSFVDDEYNNDLESYLYSNIYYTQDEQEQRADLRNSGNISQNMPPSNDNVQSQKRNTRASSKHSPHYSGKKMPPPFRGISQHLSQKNVNENWVINDNNQSRTSEVYPNYSGSKGWSGNDCNVPGFRHKQKINKHLQKVTISPQHIRFRDEDLNNLLDEPETSKSAENHKSSAHSSKSKTKTNKSKSVQSKTTQSQESASNALQSSSQPNKKPKEVEERLQSQDGENANADSSDVVLNECEKHSKYNVQKKHDKEKLECVKLSEKSDNLDAESDSDTSILEVPIPPKTPPPLISLNDSDEDTLLPCTTMVQETTGPLATSVGSPFESGELDFLTPTIEGTYGSYIDSEANDTLENESNTTSASTAKATSNVPTEESTDLILNCTQIQKCTKNLAQIKDTCSAAQQEQKEDCAQQPVGTINVQQTEQVSEVVSSKGASKTSATVISNVLIEPVRFLNTSKNSLEDESNVTNTYTDTNITPAKKDDQLLSTSKKRKGKKRKHESQAEENTCNKQVRFSDKDNRVYEMSENDTGQLNEQCSESSWEQYFFKPMSAKMKAYYNQISGEKIKDVHELQRRMSDDPRLWGILDEDLMPSPSKRSKFGKCHHCHQDGHVRPNCPRLREPPLCHMCGIRGHPEARCPHSICLTCGKKQLTFRKTCDFCKKLHCMRCKATGHKDFDCPDLWRRYHLTTPPSEITIPKNHSTVMKPKRNLHCCNCTKKGHDASMCKEFRWSQHYPTPAHVSNYTDGPQYHSEEKEEVRKPPRVEEPIPGCSKTSKIIDKKGKCGYTVIYECKSNIVPKESIMVENQISPRTSHLNGVIHSRVRPNFLKKFTKHVNFAVEFCYNSEAGLFKVRCFGVKPLVHNIMAMLIQWLKLADDEKSMWSEVNLPYNRQKLTSILDKKYNEMMTRDLLDPKTLLSEIDNLKGTLKTIENDTSQCDLYGKLKNSLLDLKSKLYMLTVGRSRLNNMCKYFYEKAQSLRSGNQLSPRTYIDIVKSYHSTFGPYTPKRLEKFLNKYYKNAKKQVPTHSKKSAKKIEDSKQDFENDFAEDFTENLEEYIAFEDEQSRTKRTKTRYNLRQSVQQPESKNLETTANLNTNENIVNDSCEMSNNDEITLTPNTSHSTNALNDPTANNSNAKASVVLDSGFTVHNNEESLITSESTNEKADKVPLEAAAAVNIENPAKKLHNMVVDDSSEGNMESSNSVTTRNESTTNLNRPANNVKETVNEQAVEEMQSTQSQIVTQANNCSKEELNSSSQTVNNESNQSICVAATESSSDVVIKEEPEVSVIESEIPRKSEDKFAKRLPEELMHKAQEVISDALDFQLPYLSKAVADMQRRINDNTLENKHVDVLQKLIALEKLHQQHVNTFSKFLE